jgi:hypothetical protein
MSVAYNKILKHVQNNISTYAKEVTLTVSLEGKKAKRVGSTSLLKYLKSKDKVLLAKTRSDLSALKKLFENTITSWTETKKAFKKLNVILQKLIPEVNTLSDTMVEFRKIAEKHLNDYDKDEALAVLRITGTQQKERKDRSQALIESANENLISFKSSDIFKMMDRAAATGNPLDAVIAIQLATGSRLVEVLKTSTYSQVPDVQTLKGPIKHIHQDGLAKVKPGDVDNVTKPLLHFNHEELFALIKLIRDDVKQRGATQHTNKQISNLYNHRTIERIQTYEGFSAATTHTLRKLYANLSYKELGDPSKQSLTSWIQNTLGHKALGSVSLHYQSVSVTSDSKFESPQDLEVKYTELLTSIQEIRQRMNGLSISKSEPVKVEQVKRKTITLVNSNGDTVEIDAPVKKRGFAMEVGERFIADLKIHGVEVTKKLLRKHFGGSITSALFEAL